MIKHASISLVKVHHSNKWIGMQAMDESLTFLGIRSAAVLFGGVKQSSA